MTKDNFSTQSKEYSQFRPGYPDALIKFILEHTEGRHQALDCATGNGQVASVLAEHFEIVHATDISIQQLSNAIRKDNIFYAVAKAEETKFDSNQFDLLTVGQAAHWFKLTQFYDEAHRILKPGGLLALFGYRLPTMGIEIDSIINHFYENILGDYWDPERRHVDEGYQNLPFPYAKIKNAGFDMSYEWNIEQVIGFFSTWSAVQHYKKAKGVDPMHYLVEPLRERWGEEVKRKITFPFFVVAGVK